MSTQTIKQFFNRFEAHNKFKSQDGSNHVIIHPGLTHGFIEVTEEFHNQLKDALSKKIMLIDCGLETLDPITNFCYEMLKDSY